MNVLIINLIFNSSYFYFNSNEINCNLFMRKVKNNFKKINLFFLKKIKMEIKNYQILSDNNSLNKNFGLNNIKSFEFN